MKSGQRLWTRAELILAINLYCKLPFGRLHNRNPDIINLAELIDRTASSVSYKLVNFASLDPSLQARGIKGASNSSKLDREIWNEFYLNWEDLAFESELLLAEKAKCRIEETVGLEDADFLPQGKERESLVKTRVNQSFFRKTMLASYNYTCCVTGIDTPELLVAGHIRPWSLDRDNRLNPRNGLIMNNLHDKAFETGFLTITPDYKIKISDRLELENETTGESFFYRYHNESIRLPSRFLPDPEFLDYHNNERFLK